jgi:hypothetical protein
MHVLQIFNAQQGLSGLLMGKPLLGQPAQLLVDQWQQPLGGLRVAFLNRNQDLRRVAHRNQPGQQGTNGATRRVPTKSTNPRHPV